VPGSFGTTNRSDATSLYIGPLGSRRYYGRARVSILDPARPYRRFWILPALLFRAKSPALSTSSRHTSRRIGALTLACHRSIAQCRRCLVGRKAIWALHRLLCAIGRGGHERNEEHASALLSYLLCYSAFYTHAIANEIICRMTESFFCVCANHEQTFKLMRRWCGACM